MSCGLVQQTEEVLFEGTSQGQLVARCRECVLVRLFAGSG